MPSPRRPITLVLLGCVLALAACGGSGSSTDTDGASQSPANFSAQATRDCAGAKLSSLGGPPPYTAAQYGTIQTTLLALRRQLDAHIPPVSMQQDLSDLLGGYSSVANAAGAAAQSFTPAPPPPPPATPPPPPTPEQVQATYVAAVATPLASVTSAAQAISAPTCGRLPVTGQ